MRRQVGSCASSAAISAGVDGTFALWMTAPFRPMTQTCVSAIDTSSPAKYSIVGSPLPMTKPILSASAEEPRPLPDVEKLLFGDVRFSRRPTSAAFKKSAGGPANLLIGQRAASSTGLR